MEMEMEIVIMKMRGIMDERKSDYFELSSVSRYGFTKVLFAYVHSYSSRFY